MRALVTGGSGFIGSNIVKLLIENGYDVRVVDNLSSGYIINIAHYITDRKVEFVGGDIRDYLSVDKAMKGVDVVFHAVEFRSHFAELVGGIRRQRGNSGASACVGFGDHLVLNMSRRIAERSFEEGFLRQLECLGVPTEAEEFDI